MRRIYTLLLYVALPFVLLRLYWKGRRLPAYRERILERFFINPQCLSPIDVWLHAVSLGEVVAATPLIQALLAANQRVLVTTMTPTGSQQVLKQFRDQVSHQYLPYDYPWVVRRFFKTIQTRVGVIMETELWPNLITEAERAHVPLVLANARISDKAYPQYHRVRFLFRSLLEKFTAILAQSEQDAIRFSTIGGKKAYVKMVGNMKFDLQTTVPDNHIAKSLQPLWGDKRTVVLVASTHDDEEKQILCQLKRLQQEIKDVLLIIVPRHPERFQSVYQMCSEMGFRTTLRSQPEQLNKTIDVLIVDAMGELMSFYRICHYAFVGGSFVPIGGHNVLEPIAMNVPVFCGPYMQNSKAICEALLAAQALKQVDDAHTLVSEIVAQHRNADNRDRQIKQANQVLIDNRGSVQRHLDVIQDILKKNL